MIQYELRATNASMIGISAISLVTAMIHYQKFQIYLPLMLDVVSLSVGLSVDCSKMAAIGELEGWAGRGRGGGLCHSQNTN